MEQFGNISHDIRMEFACNEQNKFMCIVQGWKLTEDERSITLSEDPVTDTQHDTIYILRLHLSNLVRGIKMKMARGMVLRT